MFGSFSIGRLAGIQVRVHWMFPAMVVLFATAAPPDEPWYLTVATVLLMFTCVLLHELGHSLVARRFGIRVYDITLWPLGGMARMDHIPEQSKVEAAVAIAGPAVNFVLAVLGTLAVGLGVLWQTAHGDWRTVFREGEPGHLGTTFGVLFVVYNLVLGTFNLLPAFPMDGGRVLRAVLGRFHDWVRATEIAVRVGRWIAFAMFAFGIWLWIRSGFDGGVFSLLAIALFIGWAGARELWAVRLRHGRFPFGNFAGNPGGNFAGSFGGVRFQFGGASAPRGAPGAAGAHAPREAEHDPRATRAEPEADGRSAPGDPSTGARRPLGDWKPDGFGHDRLDDDAVARLERFKGRLGQGRAPSRDGDDAQDG
ncbi:MAG: site-2 protease family protein [Planctomycetes bacterium]|nr:site-2 protease family protein [Planctomycetota bacterium]